MSNPNVNADAGSDQTGEEAEYVDSYEDVSIFVLDDAREREVLDKQTECCFMWTTAAGDPMGVIMNYVEIDGRFWVTCTRQRKRVAALEARPRAAVAISSRGTDIGVSRAVTYKGDAVIHDDADTLAWFYPLLAAKVRPGNPEAQKAFAHHLDTPGRVVIEIIPDTRVGFDSESMFKGSPAGPSTTQV